MSSPRYSRLSTFSYAAFSTIAHVLSTDLFPGHLVASVSGLGGTGSGLGTIAAFVLVGRLADAHQAAATHSFDSILVAGGRDSVCRHAAGAFAGSQ